jgi:hypothetical protein
MADSTQVSRVANGLEQVSILLREIHEWFIENLRDATSSRTTVANETQAQTQSTRLPDLTFELFAETGQGQEPGLICSHACLHSKWTVKPSEETPRHLFMCRCVGSSQHQDMQSHRARVAAYACKFVVYTMRM